MFHTISSALRVKGQGQIVHFYSTDGIEIYFRVKLPKIWLQVKDSFYWKNTIASKVKGQMLPEFTHC